MSGRSCPLCGVQYTVYDGPGPEERRRSARLWFMLTRAWPDPVVRERLDYANWAHTDLHAHLAQAHELALADA